MQDDPTDSLGLGPLPDARERIDQQRAEAHDAYVTAELHRLVGALADPDYPSTRALAAIELIAGQALIVRRSMEPPDPRPKGDGMPGGLGHYFDRLIGMFDRLEGRREQVAIPPVITSTDESEGPGDSEDWDVLVNRQPCAVCGGAHQCKPDCAYYSPVKP